MRFAVPLALAVLPALGCASPAPVRAPVDEALRARTGHGIRREAAAPPAPAERSAPASFRS